MSDFHEISSRLAKNILYTFRARNCKNVITHLSVCFVGGAEAKQDYELFPSRHNVLLTDDTLHEAVGALDDPHVGHQAGAALQVAVSAQAARQQRRGRGGHYCSIVTVGLLPQPTFDVEQSVRDVQPGIQEGDVIATSGLQGKYHQCCLMYRTVEWP